MKKLLEHKVALITGAGKGIGSEIAKKLAGEGAIVIVNYNGSKEMAQKVVEEIKLLDAEAVSYQCNVASFEECNQMVNWVVKNYGHIDILVNNAGVTRDNLLMRMTEEEFDVVIDVNLKGTFHMMKLVSKVMLKQRSGHIVNISSVTGLLGNAGQANYCASKAGVIGLTKSAAKELSRKGITVNAVAPGFIETEMTDKIPEEIRQTMKNQILLGRYGKAEEVADVVLFLSSDLASYMTGQVLSVDGGMS